MLTEAQIKDRAEIANERYGFAHETFKHLRRFYDGMIWEDEAAMTRSLVSVFRDLRHGGTEADREPDVRVTLPLIEAVVSKFAALLTAVPQIEVLTPPIGYMGMRKEETCRALADQNEKFFYGLWEQARVRRHFAKQAWYLPLMGCSFTGCHPDFDSKTIKFITRSPEFASPFWDSEFENMEALMFRWEVPGDQAIATYGPGVESLLQQIAKQRKGILGFGSQPMERQNRQILEVIEYWDKDSKTTLVAGHKVQQVKHDFGFVPWVMTPFYMVPDSPFGKGVIEGNVALFQKMNMLDSLELQAIIENVFASMVIIGPEGAPEDIERGPGAVIPVKIGGDVKYIAAPEVTMDLTKSMARSQDMMRQGTHLPGSSYGEGVASSITTGKAQHESLMPTGNVVEYVQGNISDSWERLNEYALDMTQTMFKNRSVVYFGRQYSNEGVWSRPIKFQQTIKGDDLKDWARQELTFQPMLNFHEKLVAGLQAAGGGLVSKRWQRDQLGISDNNAMQEEILGEMQTEQQLAALMGMAQQGQVTPDQVEQAFLRMEKGGTAGLPIGPSPAMMGPGAGAMPPSLPPMPPGGPLPTPSAGPTPPGGQTLPIAQNPGEGPPGEPAGMPTPPESAPQGAFTLSGAIGDFSHIKKLKGRVFLVGEIVQKGATDGPVEVSITDKIDKSTIVNGLPDEYHGKIRFHIALKEPTEQHVEVGPGKTSADQGGGPTIDHPNTITKGDQNAIQFQDQPALENFTPPLASNFPAGGFQGSLRS